MELHSEHGLAHLKSPHSAADTMARLEANVRSKGIPIHARIDHSTDAARAGLTMNPAILLIFGNARAGTPLMVASPTLAIDLPLKALAWQDSDGAVWLSYNTPEYLADRHGIPSELLANIVVIRSLCEAAVSA
jgi:uncharacterized protein (DUF302 family)